MPHTELGRYSWDGGRQIWFLYLQHTRYGWGFEAYAVENKVKDDARGRAWCWFIHASFLANVQGLKGRYCFMYTIFDQKYPIEL